MEDVDASSTTARRAAEVRLVTRGPKTGPGGDARIRFPPELADIVRPELPSLTEEIITEIRRVIPEYARPMDGPYGRVPRMGVGQALATFVELITDPAAPHEHRDEVCRKLGEYEAIEGRSLDSLQAAYRVGAHLAWRRAVEVGTRYSLSSKVMAQLADAAFSYIDELASCPLRVTYGPGPGHPKRTTSGASGCSG